MSTTTEEIKIPVTFLVDKERKKVIFAEADNDFVDTLLSFLTLPMGTIVRLLQDEKIPVSFGSLSTLYEGLAKLDPKYFWMDEYCKKMLLKPLNSSECVCLQLKVNVDNQNFSYFTCEKNGCQGWYGVDMYGSFSPWNTEKCVCGKLMNREIHLWSPAGSRILVRGKGSVFATQTITYIITDDLHVMPNLPSSSIELLNTFGIKDMSLLEEKTLRFGLKEFLNLLKCLLFSKTPLTDLFFGNKTIGNSGQVNLCLAHIDHNNTTTSSSSKKMTVKLIVQKSNKKVLFGQAEEDFVDFIFGFLAIPLGKLVSLLGGNTSLGCVDNFYKSISNLTVGRHIQSSDLKNKLISPSLVSNYLCIDPILSLDREILCYRFYITDPDEPKLTLKLKDLKKDGGFVRAPAMFMVTDDLAVSHLSSISAISFLNRKNIPFSDVEEHVVTIGVDEALSILKASLHSESVLTNGLNVLKKKRKLES